MLVIAIDNGFFMTKATTGERSMVIPSRISRGRQIGLGLNKAHTIELNGQVYTATDTGNYSMDFEKFRDETNMACTLLSIGLLMDKPEEDVTLLVGLPISYVNKYKEDFRQTLLNYGTKVFKVNGQLKKVTIRNAIVFPQCACTVFMNPGRFKEKSSLIIDVGGLTVCSTLFQGLDMKKYNSFPEGMLTFFANLRESINSRYATRFKQEEMDDIFRKGYFVYYGERVYLTEFDNEINDYVNQIITHIQTDYAIDSVEQIILLGGASVNLYGYFKSKVKHIELLENSQNANQMANANAYLNIARLRGLVV
jgi:hypothetical protein